MNKKAKKTALPIAAALLALTAYGVSQNVDVAMGEAQADSTAVMNVSVTCVEANAQAYAANIAYNLTVSAGSPGAPSTYSVSESLSNPVEGDVAGSAIATLNAVGANPGHVGIAGQMPNYKLINTACGGPSSMTVAAYGDGTDNIGFDVAIDSITANRTTFTAANKIDHRTGPSDALKIVDSAGVVWPSGITDGGDDRATPDGQIVVSGAQAGTLMAQVDVMSPTLAGNGNESINLLMHPY